MKAKPSLVPRPNGERLGMRLMNTHGNDYTTLVGRQLAPAEQYIYSIPTDSCKQTGFQVTCSSFSFLVYAAGRLSHSLNLNM